MHVFNSFFSLPFNWPKSQEERMGMAGTENLYLLTWVLLVGNVTRLWNDSQLPSVLVPLKTSGVGWGSEFWWGLWGWRCHRMFPSISLCLNIEDQGWSTRLVCVHCRDALWKHWACGGLKNEVVAWVNNLRFWGGILTFIPLLLFSLSIPIPGLLSGELLGASLINGNQNKAQWLNWAYALLH